MNQHAKLAEQMLALVADLPEQLQGSAELLDAASLPRLEGVRRVVVSGMGGSAAAAALAQGVAGHDSVAIDVNRTYSLPGSVDERTLLVFSSYSGETEETLSCYEDARVRFADVPRVVVSSGGTLSALAAGDGVPRVALPGGLPPRASLGYGVGVLFGLLDRLGACPGLADGIAETVTALRAGNERFSPDRPQAENPARQLASLLYGKFALLYASDGLTAAAANRTRAQINENAKALAAVALLPELNHNEVVGWEATGVRDGLVVVAFQDGQDHPRVRRRFEATRKVLGDRVPHWETVNADGESRLARVMSLVQFGDYLSVYMAIEGNIDPMGVELIDRLKDLLGKS